MEEPMGEPINNQMPMDNMPMDMDNMDGMDEPIEGEENSPKKDIQQLTGKLSQKLRNYNNDGNNDTETNKYAASMIVAQAAKGMTDDDKADLINKIKKGNVDDGMDNPQTNDEMMSTEAKQIFKTLVREFANQVMDEPKNNEERYDKKIRQKKIRGKNPFISNR